VSNGSGDSTRAAYLQPQRAGVQFGTFTLDRATGELTRGGRAVPLQNQPARVLSLLVSRPGQLVTREELRRALWADDTFVEFETALNIAVTKIRQALGDSAASPRFVETIPRRGYRFMAGLRPAARALPDPGAMAAPLGYAGSIASIVQASCWLFCGRREFPLPDGEHIVGRDPAARVSLASPKVSRRHAKVVVRNDHAVLIDLGSKNGSFVRGLRVTGPTPLTPGDDIRIGPFALIFRMAEDKCSTESEVQ
jgi:DNA-binding winged helix-turn-helix (wHTH) protein